MVQRNTTLAQGATGTTRPAGQAAILGRGRRAIAPNVAMAHDETEGQQKVNTAYTCKHLSEVAVWVGGAVAPAVDTLALALAAALGGAASGAGGQ